MKLIVNGETRETQDDLTVEQLLDALDVKASRIAVMVNDTVVKRNDRARKQLAEGDRVEIITMVGGG